MSQIQETEPPNLLSILQEASGTAGINLADESEGVSQVVLERRREILEAALRVFSKKGFDGSRTKEIATEAGISEATIFKYFPTKRHLLLGIMKPVVESVAKPLFMASVQNIIDESGECGIADTMKRIMRDRMAVFLKNEKLVKTLMLELTRNEDMMGMFQQLVLPLVMKIMEPVFERGKERGEIRADLSTLLLTRSFMATLMGTILLMRMFPTPFALGEPNADIDATMDMFVRGIQGDGK